MSDTIDQRNRPSLTLTVLIEDATRDRRLVMSNIINFILWKVEEEDLDPGRQTG